MTGTGQQALVRDDVLSGVAALAVAIPLARGRLGRRAALAANLLGLSLLSNIGRIAVRSLPTPLFAYPESPPLLLAYHAPYSWIVSFCVAGALAAHLVSARQLYQRRRSRHVSSGPG